MLEQQPPLLEGKYMLENVKLPDCTIAAPGILWLLEVSISVPEPGYPPQVHSDDNRSAALQVHPEQSQHCHGAAE